MEVRGRWGGELVDVRLAWDTKVVAVPQPSTVHHPKGTQTSDLTPHTGSSLGFSFEFP